MYDRNELCERIKSIFPDIGECGIDVKLDYDKDKEVWVVDLTRDQHRLRTFLEPKDATLCMEGKRCVGLGVQIGQLRENIERV